MSENNVPDPAAFPPNWYRRYEIPKEKFEAVFKKLNDIRNSMNKRRVVPSKERNVFPELSDILRDT